MYSVFKSMSLCKVFLAIALGVIIDITFHFSFLNILTFQVQYQNLTSKCANRFFVHQQTVKTPDSVTIFAFNSQSCFKKLSGKNSGVVYPVYLEICHLTFLFSSSLLFQVSFWCHSPLPGEHPWKFF